MVRSEREDRVTGEKIGTHFATSIKEVEANDWYMMDRLQLTRQKN